MITAEHAAIPKYSKKKRLNLKKLPKTWWNEDCDLERQTRKKTENISRNNPPLSHTSNINMQLQSLKEFAENKKKAAWESLCSQIDPQTAATKIHLYISKLNCYNIPIDDRKYNIYQ